MYSLSDLKKIIAESSPVRRDETAGFEKFTRAFEPVGFLISIAFVYLSHLAPQRVIDNLLSFSSGLSLVSKRATFLMESDPYSFYSYGVTLFCGTIASLVFVAVWSIGYWKNVISMGLCKPLQRMSFFSVLFPSIVFATIFWIVFFSTPDQYNERFPGMARILFWPFFPAIGVVSLIAIGLAGFSIIVWFLKYLRVIGAEHG